MNGSKSEDEDELNEDELEFLCSFFPSLEISDEAATCYDTTLLIAGSVGKV